MPLPVAHALLGASVVVALRPGPEPARLGRMMLLGGLLGVCPDFDYALNLLKIDGGGWHHGFTHSAVFAVVLGLIVARVIGPWNWRGRCAYSLAILSHPVLDYLVTKSRGIALAWPFTNHRFKLELPFFIDYRWGKGSLTDHLFDLLKICALELLIFAPFLLLACWSYRRRTPLQR